MAAVSFDHSGFRIELCTVGHNLKKMAEVVNAAYKEKWAEITAHEIDRTSETQLKMDLADPEKRLFVLHSPKNAICGTIMISHKPEDEVEIGLFYIDSEHRGKALESGPKLGSLLLSYAERKAVELFHAKKATLMVIPEKLVLYYESHGYRVFKTEKLSNPHPNAIEALWGKECIRFMDKPLAV